ncbi:hypothetical protein E2C01_013240 [Portunus trituberculatus]|uniref:Uncharacterized protein n=1 Tax=Portunus trituberculatus TaxID=210409 RepID=A0A5B7DFP5_PORTR|nr:hypothetical protein [Portunus trituberculatus]
MLSWCRRSGTQAGMSRLTLRAIHPGSHGVKRQDSWRLYTLNNLMVHDGATSKLHETSPGRIPRSGNASPSLSQDKDAFLL